MKKPWEKIRKSGNLQQRLCMPSAHAMKKKYQWLVLLAGMLLLVVSNAIHFGPEREPDVWKKAVYLFLLALSIAAHFSSIFLAALWMQRRLPGLKRTLPRLGWTFLLGSPLVMILMMVSDMVLLPLSQNEAYQFYGWKTVLFNFAQSSVTSIYIIGLAEAFYHYDLLYRSEKEREELLRASMTAQYNSLKQQIQPHFLFNSLNSLSSLIALDPAKAETFVEEMSQVYRYILQKNQEELIPLRQELEFIRSYLHLLKTRFGEGLQVVIDVPPEAETRLVPPLTLQLLVENAVKHNEISAANPLTLRIFSAESERLTVSNNLQRRAVSAPSAKVGLANIIARYRLLNFPYVEVRETAGEFAVILPLISTTSL